MRYDEKGFPPEVPCWIVWALMESGSTVLRAITTHEGMAKKYKESASRESNIIRVMIESSKLNHLYFGIFEKNLPDRKSVKWALAEARKEYAKTRKNLD